MLLVDAVDIIANRVIESISVNKGSSGSLKSAVLLIVHPLPRYKYTRNNLVLARALLPILVRPPRTAPARMLINFGF